MQVKVQPFSINGCVTAPPSKSVAHRMLIGAFLSSNPCVIEGISESEDMLATKDCLKALQSGEILPCRESGSTLRFLIPLASVFHEENYFTGAKRLMERGVGIYEEVLPLHGVNVKNTGEMIGVKGKLQPGVYELRGDVSSQFVTGLLMALPLLKGDSVLRVLPPVESRPYIDITKSVLESFHIVIEEREENVFFIPGNQNYFGKDMKVEGDWSNAAIWYALGSIGNRLEVLGLDKDSKQGDKVCVSLLKELEKSEPVIDISDCPDLGPVLFAAAALKNGAHFTGTGRLLIKESDRAHVMAKVLNEFGICVNVGANDVIIYPGQVNTPSHVLQSFQDHRIVMAETLLLSVTGGEIEGAEAINKSYPGFFEELKELGAKIEICG